MSEMKKNDGGPAFPQDERYENDELFRQHQGMSLRDWFAGQASAGLMARRDWAMCARIETYAAEVYRLADAMLAERSK